MSPQTRASGHLSHCDNSGKRKKKGEVVGEAENKKSSKTENNCLKKKQRPHNALPNIFPNTVEPQLSGLVGTSLKSPDNRESG